MTQLQKYALNILYFTSSFYIASTLFHELGHLLSAIFFSRREYISYKIDHFGWHYTYFSSYKLLSKSSLKYIAIAGLVSQLIIHPLLIAVYWHIYQPFKFKTLIIPISLSIALSLFLFVVQRSTFCDRNIFKDPTDFKKYCCYNTSKKRISCFDLFIFVIFILILLVKI